MEPSEELGEQDSVWKRRFERERAMRKEAEKLLEEKSLQLFHLNQSLEEKVQAATEELKQNNEELISMLEFVNKQKQIISEKSNDIQKSMQASWRIQKAILPSETVLNKIFGANYFVCYRPKNTVSGDFYWVCEKDDKKIVVVADCTGHGVQGALMSLIGNSLLNIIILENNVTLPDHILYYLNNFLYDFFAKNNQKVYESMDVSVVMYSSKAKKLRYSGVMQALYYVQKNKLIEIKPNRNSLGMTKDGELLEMFFDSHEVLIDSPTVVYLATDGYKDQFGGKDNRKFLAKNFKNYLLASHHLPMREQQTILEQELALWQGGIKQTDDILVFGLKLT
jgi:serine phosphatase RsbU (regulator of sigma subunit)